MLNNLDWSATDLELLAPDAIPVTAYKPIGDRHRYDCAYTEWGNTDDPKPARDYYRVAWRAMAANTGERTLIAAVIPPGASHINGVFCAGSPNATQREISLVAAFASSLSADLSVRTAPKSGVYQGVFARLPFVKDHPLADLLLLRILRLTCLSDAYADLWAACWQSTFTEDRWRAGLDSPLGSLLGDVAEVWSARAPLRLAVERRQAQVELDALVAIVLNLTADELCTVYRTQFPVLYGYDRSVYFYDSNGRVVPNSVLTVWRKKGDRIRLEERTATNQAGNTYVYGLPFITLDRETDMRHAYASFEQELRDRL